jgi:hypothetical protein
MTESVHNVVQGLPQAADVRVHDILLTDEGLGGHPEESFSWPHIAQRNP